MCGIYGEVSLRPGASPDRAVVAASGRQIEHRGPDDDGLYIDQHVALGLRRLSIIDVAGGHQPIFNEDKSVVAVCNGEIYNFRELRERLQSRGHQFRTGSDAEVLVHLYEVHGEAMLGELRGMFGFALWDSRKRLMLLARDRLGIKPVYYAQLADRLVFASESKALVARPDVHPELDRAALGQYLALGYVANPDSLLAGVRKLRPGSVLVVHDGKVEERGYWSLSVEPDNQRSEAEWAAAIRRALLSSVKRQMVSDVPLGAFLSGGIDSSMIVAAMRAANPDGEVRTYAIGYRGSTGASFYDETGYASEVARAFGTHHQEILVEPQIVTLLPRLVWHMDEPTGDAALITTSLVSEYAARDVKVILSGVGGDELWGGYDRYMLGHYLKLLGRLPRWFHRGVLQPLATSLPVDRNSWLLNLFRYLRTLSALTEVDELERYHQLMEVFGRSELAGLLDASAQPEPDALIRSLTRWRHQDELNRIFAADVETLLADDLLSLSDKMSMAHSLECRVPLLDEEMVDLAATLPANLRVRGRRTRYILRKAIKDLVPDTVLTRKKRGFGPPMGGWLKGELAPVMDALLSPAAVERRNILRPAAVAQLIDDHRANRADCSDQLFALVTLELWMRQFIDGESVADQTEWLAGVA